MIVEKSLFPNQTALSPEPVVRLENSFQNPYDNFVATARTCYSSKVITSQDVAKDEKAQERRDAIAESIYKAGHHTTLQHATFQFVLEKVSRQFIWSFLHSHPYYNSEQVSQRYVEVKPDRFLIPPLDEDAKEIYLATIQLQMQAYHELMKLVAPTLQNEFKRIFPVRKLEEKRWQSSLKKKEQEVARYVLPVATHAHLYHTVSAITLLRYHRLCEQWDTPLETKIVVQKMMEEVLKVDPQFSKVMEDPLPLEGTPEYEVFTQFHQNQNRLGDSDFIREFDERLEGRRSKLIDYKRFGEEALAQSVRTVLGVTRGKLSDTDAIACVMDPAKNQLFGEALNLGSLNKLTRTLVHPHFTFQKKLSHTADSQDQRHRMTPGSRPILAGHFLPGKPDYVLPIVIEKTPQALEYFQKIMEKVWVAIEKLMDKGVSEEFALYLLPNAFPIRFEESGDLLSFHHKWTSRLCYNAQEEIWASCKDELLQAREICPRIGEWMGPPCFLRNRASTKPICPEGDRFCGIAVWRLPLEKYKRII
ncbi:MAG: FAD-dependent thymidylate synthase [Chlamydiae bacterium]|nr:FAD-dependent thymidylate synthase [Chlamydiota bacterium]MBI3265450.1 FAD-dependent thymidylate synthase [Chlamydiota bacterium]